MSRRFADPKLVALSLVVSLPALTGLTGCATKKYVNARVTPIEQRLEEVDARSTQNQKAISQLNEKLDKEISRTEEIARGAENLAQQNSKRLKSVEQDLASTRRTAESAEQLANQGLAGIRQLNERLAELGNYTLLDETTIYFGFASSRLSNEAKQQLDQLASQVASLKDYVIEVQGFTDTVGDPIYNRQLSTQRAESVVRYLVAEHNIPVARIAWLGLGELKPVADNKTLQGRKQNRRVEVRVYVQAVAGAEQATSQAAQLQGK